MNFKSFIENQEEIKIHEPWHMNHHHGQDDYIMYATIGVEETVIGKLSFSVYQDKPYIKMIEVLPEFQRQGIGKQMIARLAQDYPYRKIKWGYMSEPGSALKKSYETSIRRPKKTNSKASDELSNPHPTPSNPRHDDLST